MALNSLLFRSWYLTDYNSSLNYVQSFISCHVFNYIQVRCCVPLLDETTFIMVNT